jgi:predicted DNA-binding protein
MAKCNPHTGSRFDDFLKDEGIFAEVQAKALKRALAEQLKDNIMHAAKHTKLDMAKKMATNSITATTTIRLPKALKLRVANAALAAGKTPHAFMLEAIERQTALCERRDFLADAHRRPRGSRAMQISP